MNQATVQTIYQWLDEQFPFENQEDFDNSGLLIGSLDQSVRTVAVALDASLTTIQKSIANQVDLLITHHPLIFSPLKGIRSDDYIGGLVYQLIQNKIALISAHTNLDRSFYSGAACLAKTIQMQNVKQVGEYIFFGELESPMADVGLIENMSHLLERPVIAYGKRGKMIKTLAIAGGSYSEGLSQAKAAGADAYLTGEVRYHHALQAEAIDLLLLEGGHAQTEQPIVLNLAKGLQNAFNSLKYTIRVMAF